MLQEIVNLGFDCIELGHGIRLSLIEGIQRFHAKGGIRFSSLHNFCPLPVEVTRASPDCYKLSSHRAGERDRAMKLSFQTIDFAQRLGAQFVVLHLGQVPMAPITDQLLAMAIDGRQFSREYTEAKLQAVKEREKKGAPYLNVAKECLVKLADYAGERGVKLGVESRHSYEEIPSEREMVTLLDELDLPNVGYWHDFGHVQVKHNLRFLNHRQWLEKISPHLFGCHLHDVHWPGHDHRPPLTGEIRYEELLPFLPKDRLLVWEMSPRAKAEDVAESLVRWKERFGK